MIQSDWLIQLNVSVICFILNASIQRTIHQEQDKKEKLEWCIQTLKVVEIQSNFERRFLPEYHQFPNEKSSWHYSPRQLNLKHFSPFILGTRFTKIFPKKNFQLEPVFYVSSIVKTNYLIVLLMNNVSSDHLFSNNDLLIFNSVIYLMI